MDERVGIRIYQGQSYNKPKMEPWVGKGIEGGEGGEGGTVTFVDLVRMASGGSRDILDHYPGSTFDPHRPGIERELGR